MAAEALLQVQKWREAPVAYRVLGLNIGAANHDLGIDPMEPFVRFIECLVGADSALALAGGYAVEDEDWQQQIAAPRVEVPISIYGGSLYGGTERVGGLPGLLFGPIASRHDLECLVRNCVMHYDALVVIMGPQDCTQLARELDNKTTHDDIVSAMQSISKRVIVSGHDAIYLEVFSKGSEELDNIRSCCNAVSHWLELQPGVRENRQAFVWDDERQSYVIQGHC